MKTREQVLADTSETIFSYKGKDVSLPWVSWCISEKCRFKPRLPLSRFLAMMPNWLLRIAATKDTDIEPSNVEVDKHGSTFLAIYHEGLWGDPLGSISAEEDVLFDSILHFAVRARFEELRRAGMLRWTVEGNKDKTLHGSPLRLIFNPACLGLTKNPRELLSSDDDEAMKAALEPVLKAALHSGWADLELLAGP